MKPQVCQVCGDDVVFGRLLPTGAICVDCGDVAADVLPGPLAAVAAMEPEAPTDNPHQGGGESSAPSPTKAPRAAEEQQESKGEPAPPVLAGDRAIGGVVGRPEVATRPAHDAGRSTTPPIPGQIPDCGIHECVRVKGHSGFHTTTPELAKREDSFALDALIAAVEKRVEPGDAVVDLLAEACEFKVADLRPFDAVRTSRSEQLSVEVEEWVFGINAESTATALDEMLVLSRTPREIFPARHAATCEGLEVCRFVVVLEHRKPDSDVTLRDIGPSFTPRPGSREDRAAALNTAIGWARSQATRLKADPPRGFRPAREIS